MTSSPGTGLKADKTVVRFDSAGDTLVGRLFLPDSTDRGSPPPVVIAAGSWTTVKEQMPARYVPYLVKAGYAVLSFDFRGFGESGGTPRDVESAARKAEDFCAAVDWLSGLSTVDSRRIGVLAICASAGYTVVAAANEPRIASIAMVAPWLHNRAIVEAIYGGAESVAARLEKARVARETYRRTGTVEYITAASNSDPTAAMYWEGDALDYYLNPKRGAIPEWSGRFAVMAWTEWLEFDPIAKAGAIKVPTRLISGEGTATPGGARLFAAAMTAPHDMVLLPGTQFDFYDDPSTVSQAAHAAIDHFNNTL